MVSISWCVYWVKQLDSRWHDFTSSSSHCISFEEDCELYTSLLWLVLVGAFTGLNSSELTFSKCTGFISGLITSKSFSVSPKAGVGIPDRSEFTTEPTSKFRRSNETISMSASLTSTKELLVETLALVFSLTIISSFPSIQGDCFAV